MPPGAEEFRFVIFAVVDDFVGGNAGEGPFEAFGVVDAGREEGCLGESPLLVEIRR